MKPYERPGHRPDFRGHRRSGVGARQRQNLLLLFKLARDGKILDGNEFLSRLDRILAHESNTREDGRERGSAIVPGGVSPDTITLPTPAAPPIELTAPTPQLSPAKLAALEAARGKRKIAEARRVPEGFRSVEQFLDSVRETAGLRSDGIPSLARYLGVNPRSVRKWLSGEKVPKQDTLDAMSLWRAARVTKT